MVCRAIFLTISHCAGVRLRVLTGVVTIDAYYKSRFYDIKNLRNHSNALRLTDQDTSSMPVLYTGNPEKFRASANRK